MPNNTAKILDISNASGIKSKHIIAIIRPDANDNINPKNLFELFLILTPIIPPIVVPKVPKKVPIRNVFKIFPITNHSHIFFVLFIFDISNYYEINF